tara:strand:+ start:8861 stop:9235 length:375 start_codon:yes stop_codon:yes gene_type:complete
MEKKSDKRALRGGSKMKKTIIAIMITLFCAQAQATLLIGTVNALVNAVVITVASPFIGTTGTTIAATDGREEVLKTVKADAYDFLTYGEKTQALDAVLEALSQEEELLGKSDMELASIIILSVD